MVLFPLFTYQVFLIGNFVTVDWPRFLISSGIDPKNALINPCFYPTSAVHPVSVLIQHPRDIQNLWAQTAVLCDTEYNVVSKQYLFRNPTLADARRKFTKYNQVHRKKRNAGRRPSNARGTPPFFVISLLLSSFWTSCGLRCRPFFPPVHAFSFCYVFIWVHFFSARCMPQCIIVSSLLQLLRHSVNWANTLTMRLRALGKSAPEDRTAYYNCSIMVRLCSDGVKTSYFIQSTASYLVCMHVRNEAVDIKISDKLWRRWWGR